MNENVKKQLFELLPFAAVCGVIFMLLPLFMRAESEGAATYIIQIGAFPLTAIGCGVGYKIKYRKNNLLLCVIPPLFYALAALVHGMWRNGWYNIIIYIAAYFVSCYLGLMLGDILPFGKKSSSGSKPKKPAKPPKKPSLRPRRVNVEKAPEATEDFTAQDPEEDLSLNTSTTEDDIEAILNSIHNRKSQ